MNKLLISMSFTVVAISTAIGNGHKDIQLSFNPVVYQNIGSGTYYLDPSGACNIPDANSCIYIFSNPANNTPQATFTLGSLPTNLGTGVPSGSLSRK